MVLQQRLEAVGGHEGQGPRGGLAVVAVVGLAAHPDPAVGTPQPALLATQVTRPAPAHGHLVTGSGAVALLGQCFPNPDNTIRESSVIPAIPVSASGGGESSDNTNQIPAT